MYRRQFLKMLGGVGASAAALSLFSPNAFSQLTSMTANHSETRLTPLPIPPLLYAPHVNLTLQTGVSHWLKGTDTQTWGINGNILGPALRVKRGDKITINVINKLPEMSTLHWHGLLIPGSSDGGPDAMIDVGKHWTTSFVVDQPAATCWYHPHPHKRTGYQVAMGLGGLVIIDDEHSEQLQLPHRWGVDDIPVIFQDKQLNTQGQIDYNMDVMRAAMGWFGELMLTNGVPSPYCAVPRGWVRLRLLNACNARPLHITTSDQRPFYVIASDGGLVHEPLKMLSLEILMGERFEILVDMRDGRAFDLISLPATHGMMSLPPVGESTIILHLQPTKEIGQQDLPEQLATLPTLSSIASLPQRQFHLEMDPRLDKAGMSAFMNQYGHSSMHGMMHCMMMGSDNMMTDTSDRALAFDLYQANKINGHAFTMNHPEFSVQRHAYEIWNISARGDMMLHPFHVHGTQFRILRENGRLPQLHRQGWKDTVKVESGDSQILVQFNHLALPNRPYMAHCHLLEHEDTGMMFSFCVTDS